MTDSKSLFDENTKGTATPGKQLMIDVRATREAYDHDVLKSSGLDQTLLKYGGLAYKSTCERGNAAVHGNWKGRVVVGKVVLRSPSNNPDSFETEVGATVGNPE